MNHPTEYRGYELVPEFIYKGGQMDGFFYKKSDPEVSGSMIFTNLEKMKQEIDSLIEENPQPVKVETIQYLGGFRLRNITKFDYLVDAIKFAGRFNGELSVQFTNP